MFLVTRKVEADSVIENLNELDGDDTEKQNDVVAQTKILLNDETDLAKYQTTVPSSKIAFKQTNFQVNAETVKKLTGQSSIQQFRSFSGDFCVYSDKYLLLLDQNFGILATNIMSGDRAGYLALNFKAREEEDDDFDSQAELTDQQILLTSLPKENYQLNESILNTNYHGDRKVSTMHMDVDNKKLILGFCDSGIMQFQINSGEVLPIRKQFYPELGPIIRWDDNFCCSTE